MKQFGANCCNKESTPLEQLLAMRARVGGTQEAPWEQKGSAREAAASHPWYVHCAFPSLPALPPATLAHLFNCVHARRPRKYIYKSIMCVNTKRCIAPISRKMPLHLTHDAPWANRDGQIKTVQITSLFFPQKIGFLFHILDVCLERYEFWKSIWLVKW